LVAAGLAESECWTMGHLNYCAIAAGVLYIYTLMSWRIHRAYGNCGHFASRSILDLLRASRDNVHHTRVHNLGTYPVYTDVSLAVRWLSTAAAVFCAHQTLALTLICALNIVLVVVVLVQPPYQLAPMNFFVIGTTCAALATNIVLFHATWQLRDHDHPSEPDSFVGFSHPEAMQAWTVAAVDPVTLPIKTSCLPPTEADDWVSAELRTPWIWLMLCGAPLLLKLGADWLRLSVLAPQWRALATRWRLRLANKRRRKLRQINKLRKQLGLN